MEVPQTLFKEKIDEMTWSFSRINSYFTCPKMFYMTYIDKAESLDSAFAQWGRLCHGLYESYAKGELLAFELGDAYRNWYPQYMTELFPPNVHKDLNASYYDRGCEIFDEFDGFPDNWEIIGVEVHVELLINGFKFQGYIDLLVRDKNDGKLIVVDHKSKSKFKSKQEQAEYARQLYLYAEWIHEKYGEYPKELWFNMFRSDKMVVIVFSEKELTKAKSWLLENILKIYADEDFEDKITLASKKTGEEIDPFAAPDYFCANLCGVRYHCPHSGLCI